MQVDAQSVGRMAPKTVIIDTVDSAISVPPVTTDSLAENNSNNIIAVSAEETPAPAKPKTIDGIASFYSKSLEGTETATGEVFKHSKLTGASNNLPLNTWVRVTNVKTGQSVVVRINDRMHPRMAKKGRVIDLTITAARKIGLTNKIGITKVSLEVIDKDEENKKDVKVETNIASVK